MAQELAQYWGLHLIGLDRPGTLHGPVQRLSGRNRDTARRISEAHTTLCGHIFAAQRGPVGWMLLPPHSDDRLEATALSPEKRARQIQRATTGSALPTCCAMNSAACCCGPTRMRATPA